MSWHHLSDTTRKARKEHRCYICGKPIEIASQYVERRGTNEDGILSCRMHIACEEMTRHWDEGDWETFETGTMEAAK